jgi:hypothetical protein
MSDFSIVWDCKFQIVFEYCCGKNRNLVVEADLSQYEGKYFIVSVFSDKNCFNNVGVKRTFGVFIQNSKEYLEFGYRIYRGYRLSRIYEYRRVHVSRHWNILR